MSIDSLELKPKVVLMPKQEPAEVTFKSRLEVKCSWNRWAVSSNRAQSFLGKFLGGFKNKQSEDIDFANSDLCIFYRKKDGIEGGVFAREYRGKKKDEGSWNQFPFMMLMDYCVPTPAAPECQDQINIYDLSQIDTAYVCVLAYDAAVEGEEVSFAGCDARVELISDAGDYLEIPVVETTTGCVCLLCTIKNENGKCSISNASQLYDLAGALENIPGFKLLIQ